MTLSSIQTINAVKALLPGRYTSWNQGECEQLLEFASDDDDGWKLIRRQLRDEFRRGFRAGRRAAIKALEG